MASARTPCSSQRSRPLRAARKGGPRFPRGAGGGVPGTGDRSPGDVEPTCAHRTSSCRRWARAQARGAIGVSDLSGDRAGHQLWAR